MDFTCEGPIVVRIGSTDKITLKVVIAATTISQRWIHIESKDYYNTYQHTALCANDIDCIHQVAALKGKSHVNMHDTVRLSCHDYKKD